MSCVGREFIDTVDFVRQLSLSFQWWFLGLKSFSFRSRFLVSSDVVTSNDPNDSVFSVDFMRQLWICFCCLLHASSVTQQQFTIPCVIHDSNFAIKSMCRPWLYFCYPFHAWEGNYLTSSLPYGSCHSVSIDDFKVYRDSVFTDDLWISSDKAFLPIPCVNHDFIFANDLMCRSWIQWRCLFHTSAVTQFSVTISRSRVTQFLLTISGQYGSGFHWRFRASTMTLFSFDFMRPPWISFRCWFHASSATQFSMMISHSMVT
jgi:hypothetical protein